MMNVRLHPWTAYRKIIGIGAILIEAIKAMARNAASNCPIYLDAIKESRKLKPSIPEVDYNGIPIRDEIELEMVLGELPWL